MDTQVKLTAACPHCGAPLPEGASFCPHCAESVRQRQAVSAPSGKGRRALRRALPALVLLLALALAWAGRSLTVRPKTYDDGGAGEVIYTDEDGAYQILIGWMNTPCDPVPTVTQLVEREQEYTFPMCLFINHKETGVSAAGAFLRKVASVTAEFDAPENPSAYITCDQPAYSDFCPDAALTSFIHFLGEENAASSTWTITMENGDVIYLHQTLNVDLTVTHDFYPEDVPLETTEDLQAFVDALPGQVGERDVVNLHLPAVTYEGNLSITGHPVNLYGATGEEGRTTFTGTLQVNPTGADGVLYLCDIDFVGRGSGVAVTAAQRTWAIGCTFTGWRTALLCHGTGINGGIAYTGCRFAGNQVAVHYNTNQVSFFTQSSDSAFLRNGTAILIEGEPVEGALGLPGCRFQDNGTDIDNRSGQPLDISQAEFQ